MAQLDGGEGNSAQSHVSDNSDGLISLMDFMKMEDELQLKAEAEKAKNPSANAKGTAIVTGRPIGNKQGFKAKKIVEELPAPVEIDLGGKNWIGLLLEYRNAHRLEAGPDYNESSPEIECFVCSVTIGEHPGPIADPAAVFSKKKDAKQYAAKLAVEWLIQHNHMPADGSVSFQKVHPQSNATTSGAPVVSGSGTETIGQQVAQKCQILRIPPPTYVITPHEDFSAMYKGYAHFDEHPLVPGKVCDIDNVYGKKKAKDACGTKVLALLDEMIAKRQ